MSRARCSPARSVSPSSRRSTIASLQRGRSPPRSRRSPAASSAQAASRSARSRSGSTSACRSTRAYCAAASRCEPVADAALRGRAPVPQHGLGVPGPLGVMCQPRAVHGSRRALESAQDRGVQLLAAARRDGALDRAGAPARGGTRPRRPAVPARRAGHAFVHPVRRRPGRRVEQPQLGAGGHERGAVEQAAAPRGERRAAAPAPRRAPSPAARRRPTPAPRSRRTGSRPSARGSHRRRPRAPTRARAPPRPTAAGPSRARPPAPTPDRRARGAADGGDRLVVAVGDEHE